MTPATIVDGTNLAFRFWHGIPPSTLYPLGKTQVFNNVLQGWFNLMAKFAETVDMDRLVIVFDGPGCALRAIFPSYKANRGVKPEGFKEQMRILRRMTQWLGVRVILSPDEADPAIAYLAGLMEGPVQIVTSDKDMMQLITERVTMLRPENKGGALKHFGEAEVVEKMGVPPRLVPQLLALQGDTSDNVPGVRGIGPKKAVDLLLRYGSLTNIMRSVHQLPAGQRKSMQEALPMLPTYLKVVKIAPLAVAMPEVAASPEQFMVACEALGLMRQLEALLEAGLLL